MGDVLVWLKSQGAKQLQSLKQNVTMLHGGYSIFEFQILSEEVSTVDLNSGDQL